MIRTYPKLKMNSYETTMSFRLVRNLFYFLKDSRRASLAGVTAFEPILR